MNLSRQQGVKVATTHQRDALAAAYKAFMNVKPKLDKVEEEVRERAVGLSVDHVKELVIKGMPISQAINEAIKKEQASNNVKVIVIKDKQNDEEEDNSTYIIALEREVERLRRENNELKNELERTIIRSPSGDSTLRTRISYLEQDLMKEINKNMELRNKLKQLEEYLAGIVSGDVGIAVKAEDEEALINLSKRGILPPHNHFSLAIHDEHTQATRPWSEHGNNR